MSAPEPFYAFESCSPNKLGTKYPPASHHLIIFFKVKLEKTKAVDVKLSLQESEVGAAVWITTYQLKQVMEMSATDDDLIEISVMSELQDQQQHQPIKLNQLNPYYPNEKYGEGFGKALAFAMRYLLSKASKALN